MADRREESRWRSWFAILPAIGVILLPRLT